MLPIWRARLREGKVGFSHHNFKWKFPFSLINIHFDQTNEFNMISIHTIYLSLQCYGYVFSGTKWFSFLFFFELYFIGFLLI